jgi:hypothetical protein
MKGKCVAQFEFLRIARKPGTITGVIWMSGFTKSGDMPSGWKPAIPVGSFIPRQIDFFFNEKLPESSPERFLLSNHNPTFMEPFASDFAQPPRNFPIPMVSLMGASLCDRHRMKKALEAEPILSQTCASRSASSSPVNQRILQSAGMNARKTDQ